jgi:violaxanthin de-epoxidase
MFCQMRCGDLYKPTNSTSKVIDKFSECVIANHHCVPQKVSTCPLPAKTVDAFNMSDMAGVWYATRGLNPMFDCFDCQRHEFSIDASSPDNKPFHADLAYKVKTALNCTEGSCIYIDREVHNHYSQDPAQPAHLANHNNTDPALLGYADDWYVISSSAGATSATDPAAYVLIYYCGTNDAWDGFQGAVLYTRTATEQLTPAATAAVNAAMVATKVPGFTALDNLCTPSSQFCDVPPKPEPPVVPTPVPAPTPPAPAAGWKCSVCAHVYDAATDAAPAAAGTAFEDLPDTWVCPVCGAPKSAYQPIPADPVYKCSVCAHIYNAATDAAPAAAGTAFEDLPDTWVCPVCGAAKTAYVKQVDEGAVKYVHYHDHD